MRTLVILFIVSLNSFVFFAQNTHTNSCNNRVVLYLDVDELPKFQNADFNSAIEYIVANMKYPWDIDGQQGKVIVSFIVTKYGNVERVKIEKSLCETCDNEVKRILSSMPNWIAGKKDNKPVNTLLLLSIDFTLR